MENNGCVWHGMHGVHGVLAQGYNHPVLEFWRLQNIYSYLY